MIRTAKISPAAPKVSRPPLERMQRIHRALAKKSFPNCTALAKTMEVSAKTIQRDIDFMRDRQGLPIDFDRRRNGFFYTEPVESLPCVQVSEGEVVALYVARRVLSQYKGTRFEHLLETAFAKLTAGLRDSVSFPLAAMDDAISFKPGGVATADLEVFETLYKAIAGRREVGFKYKSLADRKGRPRFVQPYHLLGASNSWYLIGLDRDRGAFRLFALSRIREAQPSGRVFERMKDFNPRHLLQGSLGVFIGNETHRIRIRFDAFAAQLVRERKWHETQEILELPDEKIELTMTLSSLFEVERWVLSWAMHAEVIEPAELRNQILEKTRAMEKVYSGEEAGAHPTPVSFLEHTPGIQAFLGATTDPGRRKPRRKTVVPG